MAYEPITAILSRRDEKVALFLSIENLTGILLVGLPGFLLSNRIDSGWRAVLLVGLALIGYALTVRYRGMALYERAIWQVRGMVRGWNRGVLVQPEDLPGGAFSPRVAVSRSGGAVRRAAPVPQAPPSVSARRVRHPLRKEVERAHP